MRLELLYLHSSYLWLFWRTHFISLFRLSSHRGFIFSLLRLPPSSASTLLQQSFYTHSSYISFCLQPISSVYIFLFQYSFSQFLHLPSNLAFYSIYSSGAVVSATCGISIVCVSPLLATYAICQKSLRKLSHKCHESRYGQ